MDTPDFLGDDPRLAAFSEGVDSAERLLATDPAASAVRSRSVMEQTIVSGGILAGCSQRSITRTSRMSP